MPGFGVLFVCVGNVCRSPFAERLLTARLAAGGAMSGDYDVTSAGTRVVPGSPMSGPMRVRLERLGGSAEGFASREVRRADIEAAGLVLTATREIRSRVLQDAPGALRRTFTVLELAEMAADAPHGVAVHEAVRACAERRSPHTAARADLVDPINQPEAVQDQVAGRIDTAVTAIAALLLANVPVDPARPAGGSRARR